MVSTLIVFSLKGVCVRAIHCHLIYLFFAQRVYQLCCSKLSPMGRLKELKYVVKPLGSIIYFFADDSLILMKAGCSGAQALKQIMCKYELASGQVINKDKSSILFSPNTGDHAKQQMRLIMSINQEASTERYLGLPVSVGKSKKKAFEYIKQKVWARIQGWKEKLLSKAGKEILVKAVAQAIPTYAMSCFDLTKGLCDELSTIIGRYWWSQQDKVNKIHWLSWEKLTRSKKMGVWVFVIYICLIWQC